MSATRGDFILLLVRMLGVNVDFEESFADVNDGDYYYEAIGIARKLGIAKGTGNNLFNPKDTILRQDMMVLAERALVLLNKLDRTSGSSSDISVIDRFADKDQIAGYARESIATLVRRVDKGDGVQFCHWLAPQGEAAVFLYNI